MQVSWIDPDEVRALLENIEGPRKVVAANNIAWEVHTLPVVALPPAQDNLLDSPSVKTTPPPLPPDLPLSDGSSGPRGGDLWRIRENLRSLREQAQFSGILPKSDPPTSPIAGASPEPEAPSPPPLPEPAPVAAAPVPTSIEEDLVIQLAEAIEQSAAQPIEAEATPPPAPEAPAWAYQSPAPAPEPKNETPAVETPSPTEQRAPTARLVEIAFSPTPTLGEECEPLFSSHPPEKVPAPVVSDEVQTPADALASLLSPETSQAHPPAASSPSRPAFTVPMLGLSDRLNALALWTCEMLGTQEVLLVDDYGDVLWGGHAQTPLVLSAMMAWHAGQRATAGLACTEPQRIDKILSNGRALTVLPARTRYGTVSLAAIQSTPMTPEDERALRDALVSAVEGPVEQPST